MHNKRLPELANSNNFPMLEKMMSATSASHNTTSSCAFFNRPLQRLENVTCLLVGFSILLISIFPHPISSSCEADPWSPSSFNKRQTITNLVLRFPVFLLPPPLLPLSLSHHHHTTCSHTSDRQHVSLQTPKPS